MTLLFVVAVVHDECEGFNGDVLLPRFELGRIYWVFWVLSARKYICMVF